MGRFLTSKRPAPVSPRHGDGLLGRLLRTAWNRSYALPATPVESPATAWAVVFSILLRLVRGIAE